MLNLDETLLVNSYYASQRDFIFKSFGYSIGAIVFITIVRAQIPEVDLLQLVPGFYLVLIFSSFAALTFLSQIIFCVPQEFDAGKFFGTKTLFKLQYALLIKESYCFFFLALISATNFLIPLSLDCFNSYAEGSLENVWSFDETINLALILLILLLFASQITSFASFFLSNEKDANSIPRFWKILTLFSTISAGVVTPTVDGNTQLNFSIFSITLYLFLIHIIEKRANAKFIGLNSLAS